MRLSRELQNMEMTACLGSCGLTASTSLMALSQNAVNRALYLATEMQRKSTVKFLLYEFCGNSNAGGKDQGNAITAPSYDCSIDILELLLKVEGDVNSSTGYPPQAVAAHRHENIKT